MERVINKAKSKADEIGHAIEDGVERRSEKYNMPKWKVWLWYLIAALGVIGAAHLFGVI